MERGRKIGIRGGREKGEGTQGRGGREGGRKGGREGERKGREGGREEGRGK